MIKKLRIKFICIVMGIAALMVGSILGLAYHFTGRIMEMQSISMMRTISAAPFQHGALDDPANEVRLPFFTVQVGKRGEVIGVEGGYFDLSDRDYITQIVNEAMAHGDQTLVLETGELEEYGLRYLKEIKPRGTTIVFSDTSAEIATLQKLFYSCVLIFAAAMCLFFLISIRLSQWMIKPVAKAWDQQRQFVADASHELKTPLSVIMTNAELIQGEDATVEDCKAFSRNILSTSYQMRSLVENMLEVARVDSGKEQMRFAIVDFSQLVNDAVLSFQLLYEEKEMILQYDICDGITLHASEPHLYQVLDVLLDNALKYSVPQSTVKVRLTQTGKDCLLSVMSHGDVISKEDLKNIFKRFYRGDKARSMNGSYGLGLSIAESIVDAHKGKIWAESIDGRNTFYVRLPRN